MNILLYEFLKIGRILVFGTRGSVVRISPPRPLNKMKILLLIIFILLIIAPVLLALL